MSPAKGGVFQAKGAAKPQGGKHHSTWREMRALALLIEVARSESRSVVRTKTQQDREPQTNPIDGLFIYFLNIHLFIWLYRVLVEAHVDSRFLVPFSGISRVHNKRNHSSGPQRQRWKSEHEGMIFLVHQWPSITI